MKAILLKSYAFNLRYAQELLKDVDDDLMCHSPSKGLENHPAFTIGHLISAAAMTSKYLGGPYQLSPEWEDLFKRKGPGDPRLPSIETKGYPSKEELIKKLEEQHQLVESLIIDLPEARFSESCKWRFDKHMPTLGDLLYFMCVSHEINHLSQLAAWRRAMGLPSALREL